MRVVREVTQGSDNGMESFYPDEGTKNWHMSIYWFIFALF